MIENLRAATRATGLRVAIMADLLGPKMRIGQLAEEPIEQKSGDSFILTTEDIVGDSGRVSVTFARLPHAIKPGDTLYLNDGYIQIKVLKVEGNDVSAATILVRDLPGA